jgi:hypothetical protein
MILQRETTLLSASKTFIQGPASELDTTRGATNCPLPSTAVVWQKQGLVHTHGVGDRAAMLLLSRRKKGKLRLIRKVVVVPTQT